MKAFEKAEILIKEIEQENDIAERKRKKEKLNEILATYWERARIAKELDENNVKLALLEG